MTVVFLFVSFGRTQAPAIASDQKKQATSLVCFLCFVVGSRGCLLVVFVFASSGRTQWLQPLHRTKRKTSDIDCLAVCFFVSLCFRLFICLLACLFVCLIIFSFVSFSVSLLFDDRCSNKCQHLDEYFDKHRQRGKILKHHKENDLFLCVHLNATNLGVSFPEVIMIDNLFPMSMLCVILKHTIF